MLRACNAGLSCGPANAVYLCSYYHGQLRKIGENSNSNTWRISLGVDGRAKKGGGDGKGSSPPFILPGRVSFV